MIVLLLGPPGVGKGTQAARIAAHYRVPAISTGAMFREAVAQGTALGRAVRGRIDSGQYVPDDVVVAAVRERILEEDCRDGFLLDGFPRTVAQAGMLDDLLCKQHRTLSAVLDLIAPTELIVQRAGGRRVCPVDGSTYHLVFQPPRQPGRCDICQTPLVMRPDDAPDVVRRRLEVYTEKTGPLKAYYEGKGLLHLIDAAEGPETVSGRIKGVLDGLK
jgi:adenylate kinase